VNKDYYYYIAKGNSEHILENNWIGKARRTLKYYNKYLSRVLESRIRDTNGVISKLLFSPGVDRHAAMKLLYESFQSDDKLNPLTSIEKGLDIKDVNDFLKSESLADRLKAWGTYVIATIIPIVISVIQLIWKT